MSRENEYEIDMCNGSIMDKLISFALPLMLSGMLQLMFNAVDIVRRTEEFQWKPVSCGSRGNDSAYLSFYKLIYWYFSWCKCISCPILCGGKKHEEMSETVYTAMMFASISGIIMVFVGLFFSRLALEIMGTPSDVIDQATLYMRIYFLGMPFFMLYNYGAAISKSCRRYETAA